MKHYKWDQVAREEMSPVFERQVIHGDQMTLARIYFKKGAVVSEHAHTNEQFTTVEKGSLKFQIEGRELVLSAGESLHIPANAPHAVEALEECVVVDVFAPRREDWIRGDDAYLRRK